MDCTITNAPTANGAASTALVELTAQVDKPLELSEKEVLSGHELAIEALLNTGRDAFFGIGQKLAAIRDSGRPSQRLSRATHDTFEEYCRDCWGFSKVRATQFITAAQRYAALKMVTNVTILTPSESQVHELSRCESDEQEAEVWQWVIDEADDPAKITAAWIRNVVNEAIGYQPPELDHFEAAKRLLSKLSEAQSRSFARHYCQ